MEIKIRPNKWRNKWWRNLIPYISAVDMSSEDGSLSWAPDNGCVTHRLYEFVWMALIIDVVVQVKREPKELKDRWSWPKR